MANSGAGANTNGSSHELLERDDEALQMRRARASTLTGHGSVMSVEATAGMGKTSLLRTAAAEAAGEGFLVLRGTGDELEREYSFGIALQLFEPFTTTLDSAERDRLFAGPATLARALLDSDAPTLPDETALFSVLHGLHWLATNIAEQRPLLLVVDDAQWADQASLRWLHYLAQRSAASRIAIVVAHRPATGPAAKLLSRLHQVGTELSLAALTPSGTATLARRADPAIDDSAGNHLHRLTGGNPLLVEEIMRTDGSTSLGPTEPAGTLKTVDVRIERLSEEARRYIEAAAVLGDRSQVWQPAQLAELANSQTDDILTELVESALLASRDHVEFAHPLIRSTVEAGLSRRSAAELHAAAARLLDETGAPVERVANHLVHSDPADETWRVRVLRHAAKRARVTGSADDAAVWLRRALLEATAPADAEAALAELAEAEATAGADTWAATYQRARRSLPSVAERAVLAHKVGRALVFSGSLEDAAVVFRAALDDAARTDTDLGELGLELLTGLAMASRIDVDRRQVLDAEVDRALADSDPERSSAARELRAIAAYDRSLAATPAAVVSDLARTALLHPAVTDHEIIGSLTFNAGMLALSFVDDHEGWSRAVDRAMGAARRLGSEATFASAANLRSNRLFEEGRMGEALADVEAAVEIMTRSRHVTLPGAVRGLALTLLELGDPEEATKALVLPDGGGPWRSGASYSGWLHARGCVRIATGDVDGGVADLEEVGRRQLALGAVNPRTIPAPIDLAIALAPIDPARAEAALRPAEEVAAVVRAPRSLAGIARARALLDPDHAVDHLERGLAHVVDGPWGLERMRIRVSLGVALCAQGRATQAREPLRLALDEASEKGAVLLAETARSALLAAGARPRRSAVTGPAALTPTERAICESAAEGHTNREIAAHRFVSIKAVEFHLANSYRKLGISSRRELAAALADGA